MDGEGESCLEEVARHWLSHVAQTNVADRQCHRSLLLLEEYLRELQNALLPGNAVRNARGALELVEVFQVPFVVTEQGVFVGVLRPEPEDLLGLLDRDKGVLVGSLIYPLIEWLQVIELQHPKRPEHRTSRQ